MRFFLVAGEPSGDKLGAVLMQGLRALDPDVEFTGVGGPMMQDQGLRSLFPMRELSIMGIAEILPKYRHLMRRITQTAEEVLAQKPDALITIDSPDFSLRVARKVKAASDIRTVHYVAPTVWAWRPGRAAKMAQVIDQVLALFPFEPPYMQAAGMRCDFVGHPVAAEPEPRDDELHQFRAQYGLEAATPLILSLPGSRTGEVSRLLDPFGNALKTVLAKYPQTRVVIPAAAPVAAQVLARIDNWPSQPIVLDPRQVAPEKALATKRAAFKCADVALAASGTVSLELAAAGTPMVIAYDMNWLSRQVIGRMLKVDTVTLVNLVSDSRTVPECLGADCTAEKISAALLNVLANPGQQKAAMALTMQRLGKGDDSLPLKAAQAVLSGLKDASA